MRGSGPTCHSEFAAGRTRNDIARSGFALVMVLWLMTIACAIALQLSLYTRLRLQATRNGADSLAALYLARAGVERAVAELKQDSQTAAAEGDSVLDESASRSYSNVELGPGAYTLLAGTDENSAPRYGIRDECAALNLNQADQQTLARLPGMTDQTAAAVLALRQQDKAIYDVGELATLRGIDRTLLFGNDQNRNGLLDPEEDRGDGRLDEGLAPLLTCDSAVRNLTAAGAQRVNINSAEPSELKQKLSGLDQQQADSIVEHRKKQQFGSIAELLDVKLVEKQKDDQGKDKGFRTTDKDAFDAAALKKLADLVTTSDDKVLTGRVNVNTAPAQVLACLPGLDETLAAGIVRVRAEKRFETVADLLDVNGITTDVFKKLCNSVDVRSDVFGVRSFGVLRSAIPGEAPYCCVCAVIDRTGDTIKIKSWREPN